MANFKLAILLFVFIFFIMFSSNAFAFEQFNSNPNFASTFTGFNFINSCHPVGEWLSCDGLSGWNWINCVLTNIGNGYFSPYSSSYAYTISQNSTGGGATGILLLEPNSNCTWTGDTNDITLSIQMRNDNSYVNWKNFSAFGSATNFNDTSTTFLLPRNQEGIIYIRWKLNDTTDISYSDTNLEWFDNLGGHNSTYFSGTWTSWTNQSLYVPADINNDRNITVFFNTKILSASNPIQIMIDRFTFYTYDFIITRASSFTDVSTESVTYCNNGTDTLSGLYYTTNATLNLAYMLSKNLNDNSSNVYNICCIFQSGNYTIGRRCEEHIGNVGSGEPRIYDMRDLSFAVGKTSYSSHALLKNVIPLNSTHLSITYDYYDSVCWNVAGSIATIYYNGAGTIGLNRDVADSLCYGGRKRNSNIIDVGTGTKYKVREDQFNDETGYYKFPNFQYITSTSCTCTANTEFCTDETGSIATQDCGSYGCDTNNTYCAFPSIVNSYGYGTFCYSTINPLTSNNRSYVFYNSTLTTGLIGYCAIGEYCYQYLTNAIACRNIDTNITSYYVDENFTERTSLTSTSSTRLSHGILDISGLACDFGNNTLGGSCEAGKFLIGLLLFILVIGSINGFVYMGVNDHHILPKEMNVIIMVMLLIGLTIYIPLFNPLLLAIVVMFAIVLLASKVVPNILPHKSGVGE